MRSTISANCGTGVRLSQAWNAAMTGGLWLAFRAVHAARRLTDHERPPLDQAAIRRILVVATTALGDAVMSTPAIRALRQAYPAAQMEALVSRRARPALEGLPHLDGLVDYPGKFRGVGSLLARLRAGRYELGVVLHANDPDIVPLLYLAGIPHRIGWAESRMAFLLTRTAPTRSAGGHFITQRLRVAEAAGGLPAGAAMDWAITPAEEAAAGAFLAGRGVPLNRPLVALSPGGSRPSRRWSAEGFAAVGRTLATEDGATLLVFGSEAEAELVAAVAAGIGVGAISLAGVLGIREVAAVLRRCAALVTNDSGPMHVAFALGVPTVALFGPGDMSLHGPLEHHLGADAIVLSKPVPCARPCPVLTCVAMRHLCMTQIEPPEVIRALRAVLCHAGSFRAVRFGSPCAQ